MAFSRHSQMPRGYTMSMLVLAGQATYTAGNNSLICLPGSVPGWGNARNGREMREMQTKYRTEIGAQKAVERIREKAREIEARGYSGTESILETLTIFNARTVVVHCDDQYRDEIRSVM